MILIWNRGYAHTLEEVETGRMSEADMWKRYGKVERVNLKLVVGCGLWMLDRNSWYALVSRRTCRLLAHSVFCYIPLHFLSFSGITNSLYIPPRPFLPYFVIRRKVSAWINFKRDDKYHVYLLTNGSVYQSMSYLSVYLCVCVL